MDTTRKNNRTISIDCEAFRNFLAIKMKVLAAERCRRMLLDRIQKGDNLVRDCQESIQLSSAYATRQTS
jgi:hypothetical protein